MYDQEAEALRRKQDQARKHPTRTAILGLLGPGEGGRELPTTALCNELPGSPGLSVVAYHVRVLTDAELVKGSGDRAAQVFSLA